MKRYQLLAIALINCIITACSNKQAEGTIIYRLSYILPDSLRNYAAYLPTTATVCFKGDSTLTIQGTENESTTMITHQPSGYMMGLLKSGFKRFQVNYSQSDQQTEIPDMSLYQFIKEKGTKTIAGYTAMQYTIKQKFSGDTTSAWFTTDLSIPQNFLTRPFNLALGVPLIFTTNQNGFITRATVKEIKFGPVPAGVFNIPSDYQKLTPKQLREMPVGN